MALCLTSHDVLEQRARGHLASALGATLAVVLTAYPLVSTRESYQ